MDTLDPRRRSELMARIRSKDTAPELFVRRLAHALGYRYRLHAKDLPGRPDLVFRKRLKVVFVHGCFWHGHTSRRCPHARLPKSNVAFWAAKIAANRERDLRRIRELRSLGYKSLVLWECELGDAARVEAKLRRFLG
ncbi:MAG: very short patch repair endonuclease [Candidatus Sumerlaeia bacterium]|nr:very short patch repair endonuclease [Candidatus Sumerlaeia bacterium]